MTEPPTPAEVMLEATKASLRSGRMKPAVVTRHQLDALADAGYRLHPVIEDGGAALLLATAKKAFRSGRFRPADVVVMQLDELAAAGHFFELSRGSDSAACDEFAWGPDSFESCAECGLSFWRHGENDSEDRPTHHGSES
ncbi:MAG: hypothetical protein M3381_00335 [Actinomycetota bacterium]|nr:hypothetical protein [Actinomycetota bacterium]MDQ3714495.1 hypothetical protein [Actinomycetota bacterium]